MKAARSSKLGIFCSRDYALTSSLPYPASLPTQSPSKTPPAMDDDIMDLTDSDDDLDIRKAVRKDLGHEDYISSESSLCCHYLSTFTANNSL